MDSENIENITSLLEQYAGGTLSPEGQTALQDWIRNADEPDLRAALEAYEPMVLSQAAYSEPNTVLLQKIQNKIAGLQVAEQEQREQEPARVRRISSPRTWIAAASIVLLLGAGTWFFFLRTTISSAPITPSPDLAHDLPPGSNRAVLTLGNGAQINLDSAQNGVVARQGASNITKLKNGQLAYTRIAKGEERGEVYNSMTTPRGGQYKLTLPDGTNVWLNAASSIRYPTAFTGKERRVEITGEAYFEVAQNKAKPFHVTFNSPLGVGGGGQADIQVLGTAFNINAYPDEPNLKTTLLEGAVKIIFPASPNYSRETRLNPGQQALLEKSTPGIRVIDNVDTSAVTAWKNGYFNFNKLDIRTVMRQLSRWYDVEISYEGEIKNQTFYGGIQRNLPLSKLFHILEKSDIHFKIDGKKVIVTP